MSPGVARFADVADYLAVNISSPNTPGLRDLQEKRALADLLARVVGRARRRGASSAPPQDRARPRRRCARGIAETALRVGNRRHDRRQHHDRPRRARRSGGSGGGRRPVGTAALPPLDGDARQGAPGWSAASWCWSASAASIRPRRRGRQDRRRRRPRPALHRHGLSRGPACRRASSPAFRSARSRQARPRRHVVGVDVRTWSETS